MSAKFIVVCDDYRIECSTLEQAERRLAEIERAGHCRNEHQIKPVG
jgi:hypothetical protein